MKFVVSSLSSLLAVACGAFDLTVRTTQAPSRCPLSIRRRSAPSPAGPTRRHGAAGEVIRLDGDPKCVSLALGEERRTEDIVVGAENTLQNVFIYVKEGLPPRLYPVPATPWSWISRSAVMCRACVGLQVGQSLTIRNSDPLLHNVRAEAPVNQPFDLARRFRAWRSRGRSRPAK